MEEKRSNDTNQDVNEILQKYEDVFDGIGCLEGMYQIKIDPTVSPVVHPPHKISFNKRERESRRNLIIWKNLVLFVKPRNQLNG